MRLIAFHCKNFNGKITLQYSDSRRSSGIITWGQLAYLISCTYTSETHWYGGSLDWEEEECRTGTGSSPAIRLRGGCVLLWSCVPVEAIDPCYIGTWY